MAKYAIIKTGGKQHRVCQGDVLDVELIGSEAGEKYIFEEVLFLGEESGEKQVGTPLVSGCKVECEVLGDVRGPKVIAYKFKRRKDSHCKKGHRQNYTRVKITGIAS